MTLASAGEAGGLGSTPASAGEAGTGRLEAPSQLLMASRPPNGL